MPWKGRKGKPSKILKLGYTQEVERLRNQGLSYQSIADTLNSNHPENISVSKDVICRWYKRNQEDTLSDEPLLVVEELDDVFQTIFYELRKSSLTSNEKHALIQLIKYRAGKLKSSFILNSNLSAGYGSESRKITEILLRFSTSLCNDCRLKVLEAIGS